MSGFAAISEVPSDSPYCTEFDLNKNSWEIYHCTKLPLYLDLRRRLLPSLPQPFHLRDFIYRKAVSTAPDHIVLIFILETVEMLVCPMLLEGTAVSKVSVPLAEEKLLLPHLK
ncbi:hypothetical protein AVEN_156806-1 [Araneus ventricosus]|uniref:Uncharacterized protein n=1 Tax=Araneus ventricosus TaxID=182803 RepID=A0A4Y2SDJ0_ARAVE|nr:hypothetical protein AVEN_156806-1 [Araneus ventricosus]